MTPSDHLMMPPIEIAMLCEAYARLLCQARELRRINNLESCLQSAEVLDDLASHLHGIAPREAWPWLDGVKRGMEIDEETIDPTVILLRAAVLRP